MPTHAILDRGRRHREVLPNGLTLLVQRESSAPAVAVVTHVKAGFFDEPDRWSGHQPRARAHVLQGHADARRRRRSRGRPRPPAGTSTPARPTTTPPTSWSCPRGRWQRALDIQADALAARPASTRDELARELQVIIQEAKRKLDSPGALTHETLHEVLFDRHRIRRWRIGTEAALAGFTREDVARILPVPLRARSRTIVAIVGDVDPAEALRAARARYGGLAARTAAHGSARRRSRPGATCARGRCAGPIALAELALGWRTVPPLHPDARRARRGGGGARERAGVVALSRRARTGPRHQRLRASLRTDGSRRVQRRRGTRARAGCRPRSRKSPRRCSPCAARVPRPPTSSARGRCC